MNFVNQLEDYLRDLGTEARKNHPGVKEASERAILKLRTLQNQYVSAVRKASSSGEKHPDTRLFRSSDLLHPFLLATNYPNASPKLLDTSFKAMKTLLEADAICPGDGLNMVRVWMIQAQVVVSYSTTKDSGLGSMGLTAATAMTLTASNKDSTKTQSTMGNGGGSNSNSAAAASSSSSWFGGYFSSSSTASSTVTQTTNSVVTKTAVSSSHGNAGSGHLNSKDLDKLALDILSCLLQLLELKDLPVSNDQWIQSVTLCCLLYLPMRQNVRQAAHSTLPQVLSLLFKNENASQLKLTTWDDLLSCALGLGDTELKRNSNSQMKRKSMISSFHGAFSNCRLGDRAAAQPPSQSLALELMTTLLPESPEIFNDVGRKTFGVIAQVLQNQSKLQSNALPADVLRALQCALAILQTQGRDWPAECRELIGKLIQPVSLATESLRKQADFEDGFIYKSIGNNPSGQKTSSSTSTKRNIETIQGLPRTVLWKAALSLETLKTFIQDEKSSADLWLHEDVACKLWEAASDFCTIGASCEDHMNMLVDACESEKGSKSLVRAAENLEKIERWRGGKFNNDVYILGDALWIGFNALLHMIDQLSQSILEQTFGPSLSVLQHYLKRFPGSKIIVENSLKGYSSLAKVSLHTSIFRGAILSSLCKLSLPQWGRKDASSLLKDHNIAALICLLNVIHRYSDNIGTDWQIILQTLEELSALAIASPELSNQAYTGALSISATYARFPSFSTCLSDKSLKDFVAGIIDVSLADKTTSTIPNLSGVNARRNNMEFKSPEKKGQIGGKLMNIGARAIGWNSDDTAILEDVPVADRTKNAFHDDYQVEFDNRLSSSRYPVRSRRVPYCVALLADVSMTNIFRHGRCGEDLLTQLCALSLKMASLRPFLMDVVVLLIVSHIMEEEDDIPAPFIGPGKIVYSDPRQNQLLAVERVDFHESMREAVIQRDLLRPLCEHISNSTCANAAEAGVEALYSILESTGHKMKSESWVHIVKAIASVPSSEHSSDDWGNACQVAFRCLKLIIDDFLEDAAKSARTTLLECCSTFGSARHDMNTSLTAIGLLWTIADQDAGTESVDRALAKLVLLSGDQRPEVRNCAVNTLFSCIVGRGPKFSEKQWESCICSTIFGVYDTATSENSNDSKSAKGHSTKKKSRYEVNVHHSRDSADKQWVATQALVLKGMCRLLRNFFNNLLGTTDGNGSADQENNETPWFDDAWNKILGWAYDASTQEGGRETLELRNSGVELMVLCNQLACAAGMQAAITPARVGTNMEVINGALRSIGSPEKQSNGNDGKQSHSNVVEMWRENLFLDAFDVLECFRDHLETESSRAESQSDALPTLEATQIQVLTKLAGELNKLYECCKENEFKEDMKLSQISTFGPLLSPVKIPPREDDTMVTRFVRVVVCVARITSSGPDARFLSQAQRGCIDVLKAMASDGSPEAFLNLTMLATPSFFAAKDSNGKCKKGVDILSHEASNAILDGFKSGGLSDECRVLVLARLLSIFASDNHGVRENDAIGTSYEMLIPLMEGGLESAKSLKKVASGADQTSDTICHLVDSTWDQVCLALSRMLSPSLLKGSDQAEILYPSDVVNFIRSSAKHSPSKFASDLCEIYFSGATKCLEIIRTTDCKDKFLDLFAACFEGVCTVRPDDESMHGVAEQVLLSAVKSLESAPSVLDTNVESAMKICEVLQTVGGVEILVVAVFSPLSQLVSVEERSIRRAAGAVLAKANISGVLQEAQSKRRMAEDRAKAAEDKILELEKEIALLRRQNETSTGILIME